MTPVECSATAGSRHRQREACDGSMKLSECSVWGRTRLWGATSAGPLKSGSRLIATYRRLKHAFGVLFGGWVAVASTAFFCKSSGVHSDDLKLTNGAVVGAWIKPRLGGEFGAVTLQVPQGFQAYARVFHPASDPAGSPVRWADVAKMCRTIPHQEMQWHAILGLNNADELRGSYSPNDGSGVKWVGSDPPIGAMDIETLDAVCEILAEHTTDARHCLFGLCTIQSWLDSFSADKLPPLLELPYDRNHIVLAGPLSAVGQIMYNWGGSLQMTLVANQGKEPPPKQEPSKFLQREAPNLIWPTDNSWFVASEPDFDSTLVGGTATLIDAIVKSPKLEAWQVMPTDSLADDADRINNPT